MIDFELRAAKRKYEGKTIRQTKTAWGKPINHVCVITHVWRDRSKALLYGIDTDGEAAYWLNPHNGYCADEFEVIER